MNRYKWKPTAAQKAAYIEAMQIKDTLSLGKSVGAIRTGCKLEFFHVASQKIIGGEVIKHSYGADRHQHTFTILLESGEKLLIKGRNLYPNISKHVQGEESINQKCLSGRNK
jgi:hypothetical protein